MGAYVKLLEYDNIDGMILLSELSRRRIRSIQKLIRVGRNEVVVVLRVDKEKGLAQLATPPCARLTSTLRIYRFVQAPSVPRRYSPMRRALQQEQDCALDYEARCRKDSHSNRPAL